MVGEVRFIILGQKSIDEEWSTYPMVIKTETNEMRQAITAYGWMEVHRWLKRFSNQGRVIYSRRPSD